MGPAFLRGRAQRSGVQRYMPRNAPRVLTVGSYWPYATTVFDYIRRAMPSQGSGEHSADDVYALTAWILAENKIVKPTAVLTEQTLPAVQMPNQKGFEDAAAAK